MPQYVTEKNILFQGWIKKAELIRCSAPLPEGSADPMLTRMLAPARYQMPVKESKAESGRTKDDLHSEGISDIVSRGIKIPSFEDKNEGEVNVSSPHGKKRAAFEDWEEKAPKRGKMPLTGGMGLEDDIITQSHDEGPQAKL